MTKKKKTERDRKRERRVGRCVEWQLEHEKLNGGFLDSASIPRGTLPFTTKLFTVATFPPSLHSFFFFLSAAISSFILAGAYGRMLIFQDGFPPPSLRFTIIGTTFSLCFKASI